MKLPILTLLALSGMAGISEPTLAVTPAKEGTPFQIVGHIQKFKLDSNSTLCPGVDPALQGARITVNGIEIIIPCNTIVTMPATYLTPKDIFDFNPNTVPNESGLALEDNQPSPAGTKPPFAAFEVALDGNIVNVGGVARYVAGIVRISQQSLNNGAGYINTIDADGTLHIGGLTPSPTTDARVRINDSGGAGTVTPGDGRFGKLTSTFTMPPPLGFQDVRFTADTDNPTIHAKTGYPMCVPRGPSDARCPASNRPGPPNNPLSFFVMAPTQIDPPAPGMPAIPPCPGCNPLEQAPLMVGDYINYAGTLAKDTTSYYISAHTIEAWVGIYTEPGAGVAYINQKVSLVGTGTRTTDIVLSPAGGSPIAQEVAPRTIKVEGFTTDPTRPVEVYVLEVDPATGASDPPILVGTVQPEAVPFGRFRFLITRAGVGRKSTLPTAPPVFTVAKPVKEIRVKVLNVVPTLVANGLTSGQFDAPVSEYIFAENTFFGDPLVPFNFHRFCFLAQGSGPLSTAGRTAGPVVGQLIPWPGQIGTSFDPAVTPITCQ